MVFSFIDNRFRLVVHLIIKAIVKLSMGARESYIVNLFELIALPIQFHYKHLIHAQCRGITHHDLQELIISSNHIDLPETVKLFCLSWSR